ncbi:hypothetical protein SKAU_G00312500 [Synaphobranchus kaupii]|uniref:S100/CaBP-9k-type calcium binding subdomain domain-containing protein n=1 Tax=Synaphobranchus kaupii TaxID=118154 RepID=A0A9Q1ERZ9_SYNKA|nr:hypothetical protein SKAU_G00312500 [Synaphobranchus kaupii]
MTASAVRGTGGLGGGGIFRVHSSFRGEKRGPEGIKEKPRKPCLNLLLPTAPLNTPLPASPLHKMESAISALVSHFKTFAGKDGSASSLSHEEFRSLVTSQVAHIRQERQ